MKSQELISKYIQNRLTQEEQIEFDKLVETDEDFRKELEFHENLKKVAAHKDDENFRDFISHLETNGPAIKEKNNRTTKMLYVAASVIILLGLGYFFSIKKGNTNEKLFSTYFEPYRNIKQPVVRGEDSDDLTQIAFNAYENAKFEKALELFNKVLETKQDDTIEFYKANVLLTLDDPNKAILILEKNLNSTVPFGEKKYWYLSLSYLKVSDFQKCKENLKLLLEIPDSEYKKEEAKELLKKLEQSFSED